MRMLSAEQVHFQYDGDTQQVVPHAVLCGIDLAIERGSFVALLGHNGCGKSTLAKHFNALLLPSGGRVLVDGLNTADEANTYPVRRMVGMVLQNPDNQLVSTIVEEDVAFGPENLGLPPAEIVERVERALHTVGMWEYKDHAPSKLSGGQKQRVAIAGVLAMSPDCIVLDEPTAMLDPRGRQEVLDTVCRLNRELGMTVVLITHYMEEAAMADRIGCCSTARRVRCSHRQIPCTRSVWTFRNRRRCAPLCGRTALTYPTASSHPRNAPRRWRNSFNRKDRRLWPFWKYNISPIPTRPARLLNSTPSATCR